MPLLNRVVQHISDCFTGSSDQCSYGTEIDDYCTFLNDNKSHILFSDDGMQIYIVRSSKKNSADVITQYCT